MGSRSDTPGAADRERGGGGGGGGGGGVFIGKHRLAAAISRLDQEILSLQEELSELETMEPSSAASEEVLASTQGKPDPLLPVTSGPENSSWDRWFQRVRSSRTHKWWTHKSSDFS
ncbi:hypothetical protein LUZ60_001671 [Juncus effusus]|nr:hypothetical protein LUZ60_001671 [Juncus effusus]